MPNKSWFEDWFNSPYYHILYANRSEEEAELFIKAIVEFLNLSKGEKVIDIACGKGRHAKTMAKLGLDVTGIDLSPNSIVEANLCACANLKFDVWDMRKTYMAKTYDVVFNLFSSFGYFSDDSEDLACIHAFAENLKPGGLLVFDYLNTEWAVKNMKHREIIQRNELQFHIEKKLENGFIKKKVDFLVNGENYSFEEQLKVINEYKIKTMLQQSGFIVQHTFGDYHLAPFESSRSPRLIIVAKKL
jgi:SAM-dependent methyltransferase